MRYEIGQANRLGNRPRNEDRFAALEKGDAVLLVLADGMGGHSGGEFAAQTLIDVAGEAFHAAPHPVADVPGFFNGVVARTHRAIHDFAARNALDGAPGTTGVLCLLQQETARWAHVGDSRLYLFRNHVPLYRTRDHSYVERLFRRGAIRRSDTSDHPMRNQITQCIGGLEHPPRLEIGRPTPLMEGDVVLLCSDGLWGAVEDMQIAVGLENKRLESAINDLAEQAERNSYPASDNISVLALRVLSCAGLKEDEAPRSTALAPDVPPERGKLEDAIEQIEQAIKQYADEMKG